MGMMWCYNILGDNNGIISHLLQIYPFTPGSVLLTSNIVALKRVNPEPILTVKIIGLKKFVGYFGLSIEADPSRVVKKNVFF